MYLIGQLLIFLYGIYLSNAGYGIPASQTSYEQYGQSDVQAPAYVPPYVKNHGYGANGYSGRRPYSGAKTYSGTKNAYSGTKNAYSGTKNAYSGTKNAYSGTKNAYSGTKNAYPGTKNVYSHSQTWYSNNNQMPSINDIQQSANQIYTPKCSPECKNSGICVDTNTCQCPPNYRGKFCEFEKKPCLASPPLPMNSGRVCTADQCTFTCREGHKFIDGSTVASMNCVDGQWQPTRADFTTIPDCEPECNPSCMNGGICLSVDVCECPTDFRGPQCQYSASACDFRKQAFNGAWQCKGDADTLTCKLTCPAGSSFSSPAAQSYTCLYSTGVFEPQPIPHCVYPDVIIVTPGRYSHNVTYYSESSSEAHGHREISSESQTRKTQHQVIGSQMTENYHNHYGTHGHYGSQDSQGVKVVVQDYTPKGGTCLSWAGVHYKTFDGKIYSFQSPCKHVLLRDAKEHKYTVEVQHPECQRGDCPSDLTVYLEEKAYVLAVGEDGSVIFRNSKRVLPIPADLPGIRVSMPSDHVLVNLDTLGVTIKWDTKNLFLVEASVLQWNNTEGLCGTLNGNTEDDFVTKEGYIAKTKTAFASSWKVNKIGDDQCDSNPTESIACASKSEEEVKQAQKFCNKIFSQTKFRKCSTVMDVSLLLDACQWDYCACTASLSPEECACKTVSVYAKECLRHGVEEMRDWRDTDTCPMKCQEGKLYKSCGPDSQPSCAFPLIPTSTNNKTCVEGCFCPEGLLLESGRCVPKKDCPCRYRNKNFKPGATVKKQCNTCTCQSGEWTCTKVPCGARCGAVGDPHYSTFDGLRYDFMGHCTYTMMATDNVTVEVENVACSGTISEAMNLEAYKGEGKPSCTKAVSLAYNGANIHLKQGGFILVNGKEVSSLPVMVGDVRIRAASSMFIIVQLPNKMDLWWDGNTRVFIDVPADFQGKTKGLCGTFNLNQKDDFLTPEGDVEQSSLAFANKWKTREMCTDVDTTEPEHPCKANIENKEVAEKFCSKLKGKVFEACHWHVDVEAYYAACLYDVCACTGDVSRCLCPVLGDYAMACATQGVIIQWRYNVQECELQCTGGQEYTVCADSCLRKCSDTSLAASGLCKPTCVEGCACPPGQLLDESGVCVPTAMCPCHHKGMEFSPGYKEVRAGARERELCTCVGASWSCSPASASDIERYPPAEDLRANCSATPHMEFTTCQSQEPLTCKNMHLPQSSSSVECRAGCQCKKGFVLAGSRACVAPAHCPCHHGGASYPDGHVMQEECNKCECKSGNWSCTTKKCAGICTAWGDSHLISFDGTDYDFEGVCTYLLAKGVMDDSDGFDVEIQNEACGTTGATCSKSVTLRVGGESVSLTKNAPIPDMTNNKRIKMRMAGAFVFLDVPSLGVSLQWDRGMTLYVRVDSIWQGRVKGLCGNYNGDMRDDFQTPSGGGIAETSPLIFADSWKLRSTCPKSQAAVDHCTQRPERAEWAVSTCSVLKRHPFSLCHAEVPPSAHLARCAADACACDAGADCECACTAIAAYARACAYRGVNFKWRSKEICPMQCDEECSNYESCVSPCPLETCDNTLDYADITATCQQDTCVEGCKPKISCPPEQVYQNGSHTSCVPRARCKPLCMVLEDGRQVAEGDVIEEDECHTCRCSKRQRVCTGQPCPQTEQPRLILEPSASSSKPHDEPLKCVSGWTAWTNRGPPEIGPNGASVDNEPLPRANELTIGSPMCEVNKMTKIECRTVNDHKTPKETGLDVECSLEKGLVCKETEKDCLDFEIRVYCECEPSVCENSVRPNEPHPTDCSKFYECGPSGPVLKDCGPGTLYNNFTMVCDWPDTVRAIRPDCGATTPVAPPTSTTHLPTTTSESQCGPGQVFSECAYECERLCEYYKKTLVSKGRCVTEKCVEGCIDKPCEGDSFWRDEKTCVPKKDCTCYNDGNIVKPGGVITDGCKKCQCLDNAFHCDSSDCVTVTQLPQQQTSIEALVTPSTTAAPTTVTTVTPTTVTTVVPTTVTTLAPTTVTTPVTKATVPVPECNPSNYINLMFGDHPVPQSALTASSQLEEIFAPHYAKLNGTTTEESAGSWTPFANDEHQYIQVSFPQPERVYGVLLQGSPLFNQFVTKYQVLYGDSPEQLNTLQGTDGKPKVFVGPSDHRTPKKEMFELPIEAKVLRIRPLEWNEGIAIRFELIGCHEPESTTPTTTSSTTTTTTTSTTPTTTTTSTTTTTPKPTTPTTTTETTSVRTTIAAPLIVTSTSSPPPDCLPDSYIDVMWGDQPLPDSSFTASSVASDMFAPNYAKLNGHPAENNAGSWNPSTQDSNQYIQVSLPRREPLYGVILQGSPLFDQFVTSYEVLYSDDGTKYATVNGPNNKPRTFRGPINKDTPQKQMFSPPIEAKFVRIHPLSWHNEISVRFELIGCREPLDIDVTTRITVTPPPIECTDTLGLDADLPIENIEVSSNNEARQFLHLDEERGWRPLYSTPGEWLMFNFTSPRNITGIKTKGGPYGWVSTYKILYTCDLSIFNPVLDSGGAERVFPANFDKNTAVFNEFHPPIHAQYLKVLPLTWNDHIEMRIEPIGCFEPYPVTEKHPDVTTSLYREPPVTPAPPCDICPNVHVSTNSCDCSPPNRYYDGENCVSRDQCPCVESFMKYPVGSTFRGPKCDDCVCKLGGLTACTPAKDCKCAEHLVPKLSASCECVCEPCPHGTKICASSKLCLALDKWCDGLQDCPDDEKDCTTSTVTTPRTTVTEPVVLSTVAPTVAVAVTTTPAPTTTTVKPVECPKVQCPPGYMVQYTSVSRPVYSAVGADLPPPRARRPYYRRGYSKGGFSKGGFSKGGFSKGGFSKGGYNGPTPQRPNPVFSLDKPSVNNPSTTSTQECRQFKCIPKLPPPPRPGVVPPPRECAVVTCPQGYSLKLDREASAHSPCPQYECVPPPERPVFCNVTGRIFNTFDGSEYTYDACFHILARENRFDAWVIFLRKICRVDGCQNELIIMQDDQRILLKPNLMIEYNNFEYTVEQTSKICFQKNSFDVYRLGNGVAIKSRKYNFTVLYSAEGDVKIGVLKSYMGSVDGLCGAFDGKPQNDRRLPDGRLATSIDEFGKAWANPRTPPNACQVKVISEVQQKKALELCDVITKEPFSRCGKVLNLDKWRNICLEKICKCTELVVNGTHRTDEECRCLLLEQLVAECLGADKDLDLNPWRIMMDCPAECPAPLVHYDCYRPGCEPACSELGAPRACPPGDGQCSPGCYCPGGKLRRGQQCVAPADCLDCTCNGIGTPAKYVTFEGDDLPYLANCTYLASRDRNDSATHKYQLFATNGPCEDNDAAVCTKSLHLLYEKRVVHVTKDEETKKLLTTIGDTTVYKYPVKKDWVTINQLNGQDVSILLPDIHVELIVHQAKMEFQVRVPSYIYANRTEGLCGVCAGYQEELITSNGTVTEDVEEYGKSWQATPANLEELQLSAQAVCSQPTAVECVLPPPESNPCYNLYNADRFGQCHALVEPQPFVEACEADLCANVTDACVTLQRYVAECSRQGVCLPHWRNDLCPYVCEEPLVYHACVSCEKTCENNEELSNNPEKCDKPPVEGCFCPEGKVRVNNTCIAPNKCFPCDANKEHYAGDEWQEDACTSCACTRLGAGAAHVACTTRTCAPRVCSGGEDMITAAAKPGQCCAQHLCVPKPKANCTEAKKMECGFGQVLKQKTTANGCTEFACECKPLSECEPLPNENEVEILEHGMERVVDNSGCCPRIQFLCRAETCPQAPECPKFYELKTNVNTGKCCPEYKCELPKDKCVVNLEWEAASKGGEKSRATTLTVLKDVGSVWLDGPCRSCACEAGGAAGAGGAGPRCALRECAAVSSTPDFVLEPRPEPFQCCPRAAHVACRDRHTIYKVGENWTSPENPCESYKCEQTDTEGKLEKVTTVQNCHTDCPLGSKYVPAPPSSGACCGRCEPEACVVGGLLRRVGERWASADHCANYSCVNLNGTLQVQCTNETCVEVSEEMRKQFVLNEEKVPGKCCPNEEPVACRVGNKIYQEGQTWASPDPCKNVTCARDSSGRLTHQESVATCSVDCKRGWEYQAPAKDVCCGHCVQTACVLDDKVVLPGTTWQSADNCTSYSCEAAGSDVLVTSSRQACPDVSACAPEHLVNDTCCQLCVVPAENLSKCVPQSIPPADTIGLVRVSLRPHGQCANTEPVRGFTECVGTCDSGTVYNNQTGSHDSRCSCCQATHYRALLVALRCDDGSAQQHRVATPDVCACAACGGVATEYFPTPGYSGVKNPHPRPGAYFPQQPHQETEDFIPEIYQRFGPTPLR